MFFLALGALVAVAAGCATGSDDGPSATSAWVPTAGDGPASGTTEATGSAGSTGATAETAGSGTAGATGGTPTTGATGSTGDGGSSGSSSSSTSSTSGGSTTGSAGFQPQDGPYSPCATSQDCPRQGLECLQIGADGFCSPQCGDPSECPMAPVGAAVSPLCFPAPGVTYSLCALGCAGGKPCPAGMACKSVTGHDDNVYELCI
ncbi:MAG: hypothetical protein D6705_18895 [Deltaproteobacteria bacterium]|nr:MAG: hypothetical protein D6705_18895 [Deltaproteobacteria bacterium]